MCPNSHKYIVLWSSFEGTIIFFCQNWWCKRCKKKTVTKKNKVNKISWLDYFYMTIFPGCCNIPAVCKQQWQIHMHVCIQRLYLHTKCVVHSCVCGVAGVHCKKSQREDLIEILLPLCRPSTTLDCFHWDLIPHEMSALWAEWYSKVKSAGRGSEGRCWWLDESQSEDSVRYEDDEGSRRKMISRCVVKIEKNWAEAPNLNE